MQRRKLVRAMAMLAVVLIGAVVFVLWPLPNRITQENCERIQEGMSLAEVEAILGPPGDFGAGEVRYEFGTRGGFMLAEDETAASWDSDTGFVRVVFDATAHVSYLKFNPGSRMEQSPLDNFLWRAKRQLRKWFPDWE